MIESSQACDKRVMYTHVFIYCPFWMVGRDQRLLLAKNGAWGIDRALPSIGSWSFTLMIDDCTLVVGGWALVERGL